MEEGIETSLSWNYDTISPSVVITMEHGLSGEYIKFASVEVYFTFSENVTRFEESYVIAEGGVVSNFVQNGNMMYSHYLRQMVLMVLNLRVLSGAKLIAGNTNDQLKHSMVVDTTLPTVTLSTLRKFWLSLISLIGVFSSVQ